MSKTVEISDEAAAIFQEVVDAGGFPDITSAIEEAAKQLAASEYDEEFEARLIRAIYRIERGEGIPFTRAVRLQILEEAREEYRRDRLNLKARAE